MFSSQLNLDYAIEKCGSMLEELSAGKGQVKVVQGDMLRELVKFTRSSNKQLCEVREDFQLLWRKAQARVVQASQLKVHQKNANKVHSLLFCQLIAMLSFSIPQSAFILHIV